MKKPIRNRVAEAVVGNKWTKCKYKGCLAMMKYCEMKQHVNIHCQFAEVDCKYKALGCNWKGIRKHMYSHHHSNMPNFDTILQIIQRKNDEVRCMEEECERSEEVVEIIRNNNIFGSFQLKSILHEFKVLGYSNRQVIRFCGDHERRVRLKLVFKMDIDCENGIDLYCKIMVTGDESHCNKKIKALVCAPEFGDLLGTKGCLVISGEIAETKEYESDWFLFVWSEEVHLVYTTLLDVNEHVIDIVGLTSIKIFAEI